MTYSTRRSALRSSAEKSPISTRTSDKTRPGTAVSADSQSHHGAGAEKSRKAATRRNPLAISPTTADGAIRPTRADLQRSLSNAAIETLEGREYMSASIGLVDNVLVLRADPNANSHMWVNLSHQGKEIDAHIAGVKTEKFPIADVSGIQMYGSADKNDLMVVSQSIWLPTTMQGGDGNDTILGSSGPDHITVGDGRNHINGHAGNDWVSVGTGYDTVRGGAGNDSLYGGSGHDVIYGGWLGNKTIVAGSGTSIVAAPVGNNVIVSSPATKVVKASKHSKIVSAPKTTVGSTPGSTNGSVSGSSSKAGSVGSNSNSDSGSNSSGSNSGSGDSTSGSGDTTSGSGDSKSGTGSTTTGTGGTTTGTGGTTTGTGGTTTGTGGTTTGTGGTTTGTGGTTTGTGGTTTGTGGTTTGTGGTTTGTGGTTTGTGGTTTGTGGTTTGTGGTTTGTGGTTTGTGGTTTGTGGTTTGTGGTTTPTTVSVGSAPAWATQTTLGSIDPGTISFSASKTQANIQVQSPTGMATHTVHFNGLGSKFAVGDALDATYTWNFGDSGSAFNTLTGWIGAHTYDTPGTYTASLTVTDKGGNSSTVTTQVTIAANTRRMIYVDSVAGNDGNTGASAEFAVATVGRAMQMVTNDSEILFHNGQTFQVVNSCAIINSNVLITTYGSGSPARMEKVKGTGSSIFNIGKSATNVVVQNIVLDSMWDMATYGPKKVNVYGFLVSGNNFTVRNCTFLNVDDGVNTSGMPTGVLVQNDYFGMQIRGCCIWSQGYDHVYIGNTMTNSTQEHLIRSSGTGTQRILIEDNNLSRPTQNKGSLELRTASFFYVSGNVVDGGTLRLGLPKGTDPYFSGWGVVQNNEFTDVFANMRPGLQHVELRDNVFNFSNNGSVLIVEPVGTVGNPPVEDIRIDHNTVIDTAQYGNFLSVLGPTTGVSVTNNLMIDPNEQWKGIGAGGIYVTGTNLSGFSQIANNVWPQMPATSKQPGDNYIGATIDSISGFVGNTAWDQLSQVHNDQFANVSLNTPDVYDITLNGTTAGARPGHLNPQNWSGTAKAAA